jgi:hypothetical protein
VTDFLRKRRPAALRLCKVIPSFPLLSYCVDCVADLFKVDKTPSDTAPAPAFRPVSPRVATTLSAHRTMVPPFVLPPATPSSEGTSWKVPEISTATSLTARLREYPRTPSKYTTTDVVLLLRLCTFTYHQDLQDGDALCSAMDSLAFSPTPPNSVPSSPSATPGRHKKYYVVSVGKCAGVFDNWFVRLVFISL